MMRGSLETGEIYHVYNRGVDKRNIFIHEDDYSYFIHLLYVLNTNNDVVQLNVRRDYKNKLKTHTSIPNFDDGGSTSIINKRKTYVDILAFVLMPNHYHILLKQNVDGGISKFMQKIGTGYTMIFNEKYQRSGALFQGRYKSVHIAYDEQLYYIPHYIHLNPLSLNKTQDPKENFNYLKQYKWSSFSDYAGTKNFPSVTSRDFLEYLFKGSNEYTKDLLSIIEGRILDITIDTKDLIDFDA